MSRATEAAFTTPETNRGMGAQSGDPGRHSPALAGLVRDGVPQQYTAPVGVTAHACSWYAATCFTPGSSTRTGCVAQRPFPGHHSGESLPSTPQPRPPNWF
ncbi:hypothetical protein WMF46_29655 [Sorangium sp. So ce117]